MSIIEWLVRLFTNQPPGQEAAAAKPATEDTDSTAKRTKIAPSPSTQASTASTQASSASTQAGPPIPGGIIDDTTNDPYPRADPNEIRLLIADFQGDREGQFTKRFMDTLENGQMLHVRRIDEGPPPPGDHPVLSKLVELYTDAADILTREDADIFICGNISKAGLNLRLIAREMPPEGRAETFGFGDALLIPPNFDSNLANLAYACIITAVFPSKPESRTTLYPYLSGAAESCQALLQQMPDEITAEQKASIATHFGVVAANQWKFSGKIESIDTAIQAFRLALSDGPKKVSPLVLGELKIRLGMALREHAEHTNNAELLTEAAHTFQSVAEFLNRRSHKREWSLAYRCLGELLAAQGKRELSARHCAQAVSAFEAVKEVWSKDEDLPRWVDIVSQLGNAYMSWGTLEAGTTELEAAISAFRDVMAERHYAVAPLLWAHASSNLGTAAFALAKRTSDGALLTEAAGCFDGALAVYQQHGRLKAVEVMEKSLQRVARIKNG